MTRDEILDLLSKHLDGTLTPDEEAVVDRLLRTHPEAAEWLRELALQDMRLQRIATGRRLEASGSTGSLIRRPAFRAAAAALLIAIPAAFWLTRGDPPAPPPSASSPSPRIPPAPVADLPPPPPPPPVPPPPPPVPSPDPKPDPPPPPVQVPAPPIPSPPPPPAPPSPPDPPPAPPPTRPAIAKLERVSGQVTVLRDGTRVAARDGLELMAGERIESGGVAVVAFVSGPRATLEPGSVLSWSDEGTEATLPRGRIVVEVPKGCTFSVQTPAATAAVLGTRFAVMSDEVRTRLEVEEGQVRFTRRRDGKSITVKAGQFAVAGPEPALAVEKIVREVFLTAAQARLMGTGWTAARDKDAPGGIVLEGRQGGGPNSPKLEKLTGYLEFTFVAEAGRDYHLWIRATPQSEGAYAAAAVVVPNASFTSTCRYFGPRGEDAFLCKYLETGMAWNVKYATAIRFEKGGTQTVRLYSYGAPIRLESVWLSATQSGPPGSDQKGPPK